MDLNRVHNLKVESYILFGGGFLALRAQEAASQVTLRELLRGGNWEPGYIEVL